MADISYVWAENQHTREEHYFKMQTNKGKNEHSVGPNVGPWISSKEMAHVTKVGGHMIIASA